jgi:hypothetical protein
MSKLILKGNDVILEVEGDQRFIGQLHEKTFVTQRDSKKHLMRKWDSYGINHKIVESSRVETIIIVEDGTAYPPVTTEQIKANSKFHTEKGFDSQYFIPRDFLKSLS